MPDYDWGMIEEGNDPDLGHRVVCRSTEEAEREASRWLAHLADTGRHDWKRVEPLQIKARPTHNLPCRVLGIAGENSDGGYSPLFMLMAGIRRRRRYWQYTTRDVVSGEIHSPEKALADIDWLIGALMQAADLPPLPKRPPTVGVVS